MIDNLIFEPKQNCLRFTLFLFLFTLFMPTGTNSHLGPPFTNNLHRITVEITSIYVRDDMDMCWSGDIIIEYGARQGDYHKHPKQKGTYSYVDDDRLSIHSGQTVNNLNKVIYTHEQCYPADCFFEINFRVVDDDESIWTDIYNIFVGFTRDTFKAGIYALIGRPDMSVSEIARDVLITKLRNYLRDELNMPEKLIDEFIPSIWQDSHIIQKPLWLLDNWLDRIFDLLFGWLLHEIPDTELLGEIDVRKNFRELPLSTYDEGWGDIPTKVVNGTFRLNGDGGVIIGYRAIDRVIEYNSSLCGSSDSWSPEVEPSPWQEPVPTNRENEDNSQDKTASPFVPNDVHMHFRVKPVSTGTHGQLEEYNGVINIPRGELEYGKQYGIRTDSSGNIGSVEFIILDDGNIKVVLRCENENFAVEIYDLQWSLNGNPVGSPVTQLRRFLWGSVPGNKSEVILRNPLLDRQISRPAFTSFPEPHPTQRPGPAISSVQREFEIPDFCREGDIVKFSPHFNCSGVDYIQDSKSYHIPVERPDSADETVRLSSFTVPGSLKPGEVTWIFTDDRGAKHEFSSMFYRVLASRIDDKKLRSYQYAKFEYELDFGTAMAKRKVLREVKVFGPIELKGKSGPKPLSIDKSGHAYFSGSVRAKKVAPGSEVPFRISLDIYKLNHKKN